MKPDSIAWQLAKIVLEVGAVQLRPQSPFTWASGYKMPVYNDNRLLLGNANTRQLIVDGFCKILETFDVLPDVIAGTATAGIPHATSLADRLKLPLVYVRSKAKDHGKQSQIEGPLISGQNVVVVEDLISTGGSAIKAINALRGQGVEVLGCLSIFSYGFKESEQAFKDEQCTLHCLLTFANLLEFIEKEGVMSETDQGLLKSWFAGPFHWSPLAGS